jgi:HEPN domain-containing protein
MTKDKAFQRGYAKELTAIARGDLESAEILAGNLTKGRKENICFSAQQSIEKVLKAVLCAAGKPVPMTHSIEVLLDRLGSDQPEGGDRLIELTDFATIRRYEEGHEIITAEDIAATLNAAKTVLVWGEARVSAILGVA